MFKPSNYDSTRRYPIIEEIYPGPPSINVQKTFVAGARTSRTPSWA
ncbi:MAG: hypothetical protein IPK33_00345 [Gemmatimonadetes bacterium]|nr:hypothetical protein [Gemmatimonadota bacterium]